jgi:hypothetical protein
MYGLQKLLNLEYISGRGKRFIFLNKIQISPETQSASYSIVAGNSFPGGKAEGTSISSLISI